MTENGVRDDECHARVHDRQNHFSSWPCMKPVKGKRLSAGKEIPVCGIHLRAKYPPSEWRPQ